MMSQDGYYCVAFAADRAGSSLDPVLYTCNCTWYGDFDGNRAVS
jgi:hypothetical protein